MRMTGSTIEVQTKPASLLQKRVCLCLGHFLFCLGFIGVFLPVLPTTVFWIGAAMCYAKSSPERFQQLLNRADKGKVIEQFLEHGVISKPAKRVAVLGMLCAMAVLLWLQLSPVPQTIGLIGISIGMVYVLTRRSAVQSD